MTKKNRERLLSLARLLDRWAMQLRAYVRKNTPKRARKVAA
jgi:hypothetical protein